MYECNLRMVKENNNQQFDIDAFLCHYLHSEIDIQSGKNTLHTL